MNKKKAAGNQVITSTMFLFLFFLMGRFRHLGNNETFHVCAIFIIFNPLESEFWCIQQGHTKAGLSLKKKSVWALKLVICHSVL